LIIITIFSFHIASLRHASSLILRHDFSAACMPPRAPPASQLLRDTPLQLISPPAPAAAADFHRFPPLIGY